jgi:hypothetical protein
MLQDLLHQYNSNEYTYLSTDQGWLSFDNPTTYFNKYLGHYKSLDIDSLLKDAVFVFFTINNITYRHGHQNIYPHRITGKPIGISFETSNLMLSRLINLDFELSDYRSFEDLHDFLLANKVDYYGPLAIYDLSLRLSSTKQIYPRKIFLHSGAEKGWNNLCRSLNIPNSNNLVLEKNNLPIQLQQIEAYVVEDFLCCYKDKLRF